MHYVIDRHTRRLIEGAQRYALANPSDPFVLRRALTHIRVGICGDRHENKELKMPAGPAGYDAEPATETRQLDPGMHFSDGGSSYQARVWRSVVRP